VRSFREHHGLTPQAWRGARGQPLVWGAAGWPG